MRVAVEAELAGGDVVRDTIGDTPCLFLRGLYGAERDTAGRLRALARGSPPWPAVDLARAIPWVEARTGKVRPPQRAAVELVLGVKVAVVTGGPGVGKTTLLDTILRVLRQGRQAAARRPTGRATKRMAEQTGLEARTVHRLLEVDPKRGGFRKGADDPLDCDLLVLDEASMVDVPLMNAITKAIPRAPGCCWWATSTSCPPSNPPDARRRD